MWTTWPRTRRKSHVNTTVLWKNAFNFGYCFIIVLAAMSPKEAAKSPVGTTQCPSPELIPGCPCYNFEDGLFLECNGATENSLRAALTAVASLTSPKGGFKDEKITFFGVLASSRVDESLREPLDLGL